MKQVEIYANFAVGDDLDSELLEEAVEAAIKDVLFFDMTREEQQANFDDIVESVQVSLLPPDLKNSDF